MIFLKEEMHHTTKYTLTIDDSEMVPTSVSERELFDKYFKSKKISDKLLALEMTVQMIEHAKK